MSRFLFVVPLFFGISMRHSVLAPAYSTEDMRLNDTFIAAGGNERAVGLLEEFAAGL
jgi:hypothetical protein